MTNWIVQAIIHHELLNRCCPLPVSVCKKSANKYESCMSEDKKANNLVLFIFCFFYFYLARIGHFFYCVQLCCGDREILTLMILTS